MNITEMVDRVKYDLKDFVEGTAIPQLVDDCDSLWQSTHGNITVTLDQSLYKQGTGSMKAVFTAGFPFGLSAYHNSLAPIDLTDYDTLRCWVRSSIGLETGPQIVLDDTEGCPSPLKYLQLPACQATYWHHHSVGLGDTSALSAVISVGLYTLSNPFDRIVHLDAITAFMPGFKWSEAEVQRHVEHALTDLSYYLPYEYRAEVATTAGSRQIDIATLTDRIQVFAVEYPLDSFPPSFQRFSLWQDVVTLLGDRVPDGSDCRIYYGKLHTIDAEGCTLPAYLEELLAIGAQGYALQAYASYGLDRAQPDYHYAADQAMRQARAALDDFRGQCKRLARHGRVRGSGLYLPATDPADNTTVIGP